MPAPARAVDRTYRLTRVNLSLLLLIVCYVVDKPFDSGDGVKSIAEAAKAANVAFLDGTHFVHSLRTAEVRSAASRMGPITQMTVSFTHPVDTSAPGAIRGDVSLEPAGALGDVGWYCFRAAVAMVGARAATVKHAGCTADVGPRGVVNAASGFVAMSGGATLSFDCGFRGPSRQRMEVMTPTGSIVVSDFVLPLDKSSVWDSVRPDGPEGSVDLTYRIDTTCETAEDGSTRVVWPSTERIEVHERSTHAATMVATFVRLAAQPDERDRWAAESLATQRMLDACLADALDREDSN